MTIFVSEPTIPQCRILSRDIPACNRHIYCAAEVHQLAYLLSTAHQSGSALRGLHHRRHKGCYPRPAACLEQAPAAACPGVASPKKQHPVAGPSANAVQPKNVGGSSVHDIRCAASARCALQCVSEGRLDGALLPHQIQIHAGQSLPPSCTAEDLSCNS